MQEILSATRKYAAVYLELDTARQKPFHKQSTADALGHTKRVLTSLLSSIP